MSMVPGYYPSVPVAAPQQPQLSAQAQSNIYTATTLITQVLQLMVNQGICTLQEAQILQNTLNNTPNQLANFQMKIYQTFGDMAVAPQQIQNAVYSQLQNALGVMRMNMNRAPAPAVNFAGGLQQPMAYAAPQPISPSTQRMMETYGQTAADQNAAMSPKMAPTIAPPQVGSNNPTGTVTPPAHTPTNQVYNIEVPQEDIPVPEWFEVPMPQEKITQFDPNSPLHGCRPYKTYKLLAPPSLEYGITCWRIVEVQLDEGGAFYETSNAKKAEPDWAKEMDMVSYDEVKLIEVPFLSAQKTFKEAKATYAADKTARGAIEVCKKLEGQGTFGAHLTNILLKYFNQAASVNFIKFNPATGGVDRMGEINNIQEFSRLLTDNNDDTFAKWKEDTESFSQALKMCLFSSFNRVFSAVTDGYMDVSKKQNKDWLLVKFYNEIGIKGGLTTVMARDLTAEQEKDIQDKLSRYFALKVERKILIHDLDIADVGAEDFRAFPVTPGLGKGIMTNVLKHFGSIDLIDRKDPTQLQHPLRLGSMYGGALIVRRMLS